MNRKQSLRQAFILVCVFQFSIFNFSATAQVTIGSDLAPNVGALLDLKENSASPGANSSKGLNLPRVTLQSLTSLAPCAGNSDAEKKAHTGLFVYNTVELSDLPVGVCTWNGTKWVSYVALPTVFSGRVHIDTDMAVSAGGGDIVMSMAVPEPGLYHVSAQVIIRNLGVAYAGVTWAAHTSSTQVGNFSATVLPSMQSGYPFSFFINVNSADNIWINMITSENITIVGGYAESWMYVTRIR